jgi:hypothetical protein
MGALLAALVVLVAIPNFAPTPKVFVPDCVVRSARFCA